MRHSEREIENLFKFGLLEFLINNTHTVSHHHFDTHIKQEKKRQRPSRGLYMQLTCLFSYIYRPSKVASYFDSLDLRQRMRERAKYISYTQRN